MTAGLVDPERRNVPVDDAHVEVQDLAIAVYIEPLLTVEEAWDRCVDDTHLHAVINLRVPRFMGLMSRDKSGSLASG